jgi:GAF domain-containing protein
MSASEDLASALAGVATLLSTERDVLSLLQRVTELAVETIGPCEHADVMVLTRHADLTVPAASDWVGPRIVSMEAELQEGPCLEAARTSTVVRIDDHATEARFPRFTARCLAETPVRSSVGLPVTVGGRTFGAIDLYADRREAFADEDTAAGALFAVHAGIAIAGAAAREEFTEALRSRDVIGQAKGILMEREGVSSDDAFDMLRRASQTLNTKLRDVAQGVVDEANEP